MNFFPLKFVFVMDKQATESNKGTKPNSIVCADCDGNGKFVILFFSFSFLGLYFCLKLDVFLFVRNFAWNTL